MVLKPGGYHIMLMDLKQPLKEGDLLKLTLVFEKAGEIEVEATVEPIGAKGPHGFDSQPGDATRRSRRRARTSTDMSSRSLAGTSAQSAPAACALAITASRAANAWASVLSAVFTSASALA